MCVCVGVHVCCFALFSFVARLFVCVVCLCVGQGSRHAAVCRPAVPVNGGTADDTTTADGGGSEVAGTGGNAAGNTHTTRCNTHTDTLASHTITHNTNNYSILILILRSTFDLTGKFPPQITLNITKEKKNTEKQVSSLLCV